MFDIKQLPQRALCDTGFWIRALGERPGDVRSPDAIAFFEEMKANGRELLIAAPSLAELIRGNQAFKVPSTLSVIVVPFDRLAAEVLGKKFSADVIKQQRKANGYEKAYIQYDAMIIACAIRHKADCIISFDTNVFEDAENLEIPIHKPKNFKLPLLRDLPAGIAKAPTGGD
ncbi:MAG TPA: PIN domain-containing protein, partial [Archangium sp.]|nr:PIN domain-containing protein [Archangium sp.]